MQNKNLKFRWIENPDSIGEMEFTFDGERIFNLHRDYPHALTNEEKELFDKENPFWAEFFKDRSCEHDWVLKQKDTLHKQMIGQPDQWFDLYECAKCGKIEMREQEN